jgi:cyclopropane fatty-acyl-phospholipid synthase-like methyltransferase
MDTIFNNEYSSFFAEFYDVLHTDTSDVKALIRIAQKHGPHVLELGSGTGRILIPMAKVGLNVTGIEISQDMIDIANRKLGQEELAVKERCKMVKADVLDFSLDATFDLILASCNFVNHFTDYKSLKKMFAQVRNHLKDEGAFLIDCSLPNVKAMIYEHNKREVFDYFYPKNGTNIVDKFTPSYDLINQLEHDHIVLEEYKDGKLLRSEECKETVSFYFPRELIFLLESEGLTVFHQQGSLFKDIPIDQEAEEMVFFCRKNAD